MNLLFHISLLSLSTILATGSPATSTDTPLLPGISVSDSIPGMPLTPEQEEALQALQELESSKETEPDEEPQESEELGESELPEETDVPVIPYIQESTEPNDVPPLPDTFEEDNQENSSVSTVADTFYLPAVMYHSLSEEPMGNPFILTVEEMREDLEYLKEHNYNPIHMEDLINFVFYQGDLPENPILLTFDDGYQDNYTYLFPLLEEFEMKAIICLITSKLDEEAFGSALPFLTTEQVQEMDQSPYVEFQCHTYDLHFSDDREGSLRLAGESLAEYQDLFREDLTKSREVFASIGLEPATTFSYPGGQINYENRSLVGEQNYLASFATFPLHQNKMMRGNPWSLIEISRMNRDQGLESEDFFDSLFLSASEKGKVR